MTDKKGVDFWAEAKAETEAKATAKPAASTVGCTCPPWTPERQPCAWCGMSDEERERLRNAEQTK